MVYSIKVDFGLDSVIDVTGDDYETVVKLFNQVAERFAPLHKAASLKAARAKLRAAKKRNRL